MNETAYDKVTRELARVTQWSPPNEKADWRCPAHQDGTPSLSVSRGDKGVVVKCQAGCETKDVVEALGLTMRDLFDEASSNGNGKPDIVATYDYQDEGGQLLFQVVRMVPKTFRQRRRSPTGEWQWNLADTRRVLYRLPRVLEAVQRGHTVFVVEGEKDVHAIEAAGATATCNAGGAGKWRDEYGRVLAGANVVIVADKDGPGRQHAHQVAASLQAVGATVRMTEAAEGKDAADHLAAGYTLEQLVGYDWQADSHDDDPAEANLLDERPPPPAPVDQFEADVEWQVRRLRVNDEARTRWNAERNAGAIPDFEDIAAVVRGEYEPLLPTMLTRSDGQSLMYPGLLHWLYGPDGCGKTMIAAYACAELLRKGGTVVYFDWEGNRGLVGERIAEMGADPLIVDKQMRYTRPGNLEPYTDWLAEGAAREWHLAIFDGAAKALAAAGRDEDSNRDVLAWMEAVVTPLTSNGCAVLMLDHVTKDPEGRGMPRGAGAKRNQVSGAAWEMRKVQAFNRRTAGHARLIQWKDREGRTGTDGDTVAELHVRPSRGRTLFTLEPPSRSAADLHHARAMERAYEAVQQWTAANHGEWPNTTKVVGITGGNKGDVAKILDELDDLGHVRSHKTGRGTTWEPITPYRAPVQEPAPGLLNAPDVPWDVLGGQ